MNQSLSIFWESIMTTKILTERFLFIFNFCFFIFHLSVKNLYYVVQEVFFQ